MKKFHLLLVGLIGLGFSGYAGGLVTNTNQSAAWARTLTREASLGIDAVYFNPAGLVHLTNGLHLSLSNQTIFQTRQISSSYPFLTDSPRTYEAELTAPLFPSMYVAFKRDKWAFSAGFNIIGGGGSADYKEGLPSFEIPVSNMVPMLQQSLGAIDQGFVDLGFLNPGFSGITGYNMNAAFNGSSRYMGFQAGATYAITDMLSVAIGARYVSASNTYEGSLTGITIDAPAAYGGTQTPGDYLRTLATIPALGAYAPTLNGTAAALDAQTADKELVASQSGSGFTPIIGVNLHLTDMINIAARYEHHTSIEMTNETEVDDVGMFPDGEKERADLPGMFAFGARVQPIGKLTVSAGFNYFLDKPAYYGVKGTTGEQINNETTIESNAYTVSASVEYKLLGILGVSAGYSTGNLGVNDLYQSDMNYANKSSSVGGGLFINAGKLVTINAGVVYVMYDDYQESFTSPAPYTDTYMKNTMLLAVGVDISL
jgi:long-chain fatty acid transport protein